MTSMKKTIVTVLAVSLLVLTALSRLDTGEQGRQRLERSVRRTAAACYASEGFYPPSVDYMERNWGLQYEKDRYVVRYEVFASNLMPQITVLEKMP